MNGRGVVRRIRERTLKQLRALRSRVRRRWPTVDRRAIRAAERVRRLRARLIPRAPTRPLERIIHAFALATPDATFIQVGAHDGTQLDPLREAILGSAWRGVMIEPVPYVFDRLADRYGAHPRVALEMVAIADSDGTRPFHHLPEHQGDPDEMWKWYDALGSFRRDVIESHTKQIPSIAEALVTTDVTTSTLDSVCERHQLGRVDVIQVDTEGYDLEVLKLIDLDRLDPQIIVYEHLHLSLPERTAARDLLARHGFSQISDGMDTICVADSALSLDRVRVEFEAASVSLADFVQ